MRIADVIDLDAYPIEALDSPDGQRLLQSARTSLRETGGCELPGFLRPAAVQAILAETGGLLPGAHRSDDSHNVFFEPIPKPAAATDLRALRQHSSKLTIAWDRIPPGSPLRTLYGFDPLTRFLGEVLEAGTLHRYDDELGACTVAVFEAGDELGWHFDRASFAVTLMLAPCEAGGVFEYVPGCRDDDATLHKLLAGRAEGVSRLANEAGTLSVFRGHRSLHRVTPVEGARRRVNVVLAYSETPGEHMNALTQQLFYGRTT